MRIKSGEENVLFCVITPEVYLLDWLMLLVSNCDCLLEYNRDYTTLPLIKQIDECRRLPIICNISSEEHHRCCCCDKYHENICKAWHSCTIKLQDIVHRFLISQFLHTLPNVQGGTVLHSSKTPLITPVSITYTWEIIHSVPTALSCQRSSVQHRSRMKKKRK